LDLVAKVTQKFFRHEGHVDRKHQQMRAVRLRQRSSKAAERPARWRLVCDELNIGRTPHWISFRRNKDFYRFQLAEEFELNLPEPFSGEEDGRFIFAHPAR